ncbi:FtsW/RodA/SpoVE family cell cycle protein [Effusibacillus dendaii]|uniref:Rod shape-determining protein RodA n=1 Tax=Effusibacillus dendaii TaxID=2743772 RepID=A0A7I8D8V0_9BACL|nr:FtsW/RodA/SpoVE family cell cycle protein [Effusibacillus dendaii]BCJ86554.1 rod shape-determining protein RodA [Effusibacillus dendaii]
MVSFDWLKRHARDFDFIMLLVLIAISVISFLAVYSATIPRSGLEDYYKKQIIWQALGFAIFFALVLTDYRIFDNSRFSWICYGVTMVLLVAVLFFPAINGQKSWIQLPGFQLQPSELAKLVAIIGMASYMSKMNEREESLTWRNFVRITAIWLLPFLLIMVEPDLGQGLVMIGLYCAMMILVLKRKWLWVFGGLGGALVAAYFSAITIFQPYYLKFVHLLPLKEYQKARFVVVIDPKSAGDWGYQVYQAIIAIGNGGLPGRGLLAGSQTQGAFVPEQQTDMIFSAIGEDFGFIGTSTLIILFFILLQRMMKIASTATDSFGTYIIVGAMGMFGFQIFENIGMNLALMPATGITLPFVSYGGTSLLTNFMLIGIVQSIAIRRRKLRF